MYVGYLCKAPQYWLAAGGEGVCVPDRCRATNRTVRSRHLQRLTIVEEDRGISRREVFEEELPWGGGGGEGGTGAREKRRRRRRHTQAHSHTLNSLALSRSLAPSLSSLSRSALTQFCLSHSSTSSWPRNSVTVGRGVPWLSLARLSSLPPGLVGTRLALVIKAPDPQCRGPHCLFQHARGRGGGLRCSRAFKGISVAFFMVTEGA
ncbi:hypothetical protein E2C01_072375 [Portunus trituberculatus]|uniref:Uncharacterized protein n=1 Tax=Portunus trituberculatus TaxID=210409 RepID=A0A5B7I7J6_PORTR|nr:hypothetical protein [Portunus trituberculatus]